MAGWLIGFMVNECGGGHCRAVAARTASARAGGPFRGATSGTTGLSWLEGKRVVMVPRLDRRVPECSRALIKCIRTIIHLRRASIVCCRGRDGLVQQIGRAHV